ncbi:MAG: MoaD/ThiS family protein, partial [Candidatus Aenigmarchaeota archaeon]|nr:MoaD/ThiS family protein [Candidatus Aenigmarchaeota archaeon]
GSVLSSPTDNSIPKEGVLTVVDKESENIELTKGSSLENLYEILKEKHSSAFRAPINEYVFVVNGKKKDPKKTLLLCDKDNVSVFPLVGGG